MAIKFNLTYGMHSRVRKLDERAVREIRKRQGKTSADKLAKKFKIHKQTVWSIWNRRSWAHLEE